MLYQWNRKKAWPATGDVTGWDSSSEPGDTWVAENNPCPMGWRLPTHEETLKLADEELVTSVWTMQDSIYGRQFTDKASGKSIFLPAMGYRYHVDGKLNTHDIHGYLFGYYWSATRFDVENGYDLGFFEGFVRPTDKSAYSYGFGIRCVKK
jgi:uncharacterized protein (TIGR02145 family)